jgi:5-methyltetrahydrofolate--homocysteine methyltransferase
MVNLKEISQSVIDGDSSKAVELTKNALEVKIPAETILREGLVPAMKKVGELFERGEYYFPELLLAGEVMKGALEYLKPTLGKGGATYAGKYAIGTVQGDIHDIGKNIIIMMLEVNGWEVIDLGVDVSTEDFCSAVKEGAFQILGMSSLLTLTMPHMTETIEALKEAGLRDKVKVMIGGAPVTQGFADKIGADAFGRDAVEAINKAASFVSEV